MHEAYAYVEANVGTFRADSYIGRVVGYMWATAVDIHLNGAITGLHSGKYGIYTEANVLSTAGVLLGLRAVSTETAIPSSSSVTMLPALFELSNPVAVGDEAPRRLLFRAKGSHEAIAGTETTFAQLGVSLVLDIYEGNTFLTRRVQPLTTRWATYVYELPSYLTLPISDYNDLRVAVAATGQTDQWVQLSRLFFEMPAAATTATRTAEDGSVRHLEDGTTERTLEQ